MAAILNFFSHSIRQIEVDDLGAAPTVSIGGMRKGGFSGSALKPLLRGELRHRCVTAPFAGAQRASGVGGTRISAKIRKAIQLVGVHTNVGELAADYTIEVTSFGRCA